MNKTMEIYLDSADLDEIRAVLQDYPIDGVTTNPTILARSRAEDPVERLKQISYIIGNKKLFVQLTSTGVKDCLTEAEKLFGALARDNLIFKIPALPENAAAIAALARQYSVCATAVYTVPQALLAAQAGATYIAPYVSHLDAMSLDGPELAIRMQNTLKVQGSYAKILGASFRICSQSEKLMSGGVAAMTITAQMLKELWSSAGTDREVQAFRENWEKAYGQKELGDFAE